ncbi:MAG: metallophosphoesterase [Actinobacteria bacterium]|nr:metallophosphoesterase [Actinomycetota bacterium]
MADEGAPRALVNYTQLARGGGATEAVSELEQTDSEEASAAAAAIAQGLVALKDAETLPDVMSSPDDQRGALLQSFLAEQAEAEGKVEPFPVSTALEARFDDKDIARWIAHAGWPWIKSHLGLQHKSRFLPPPGPADWSGINDDARIALLGDWGTGMYGAPRCATSISADREGFGAVVHLGDVYYAGTKKEVRQHFLNHWPRVPGAVQRACNSNHEMYSGGGPYFTETLPKFGQSSSVFVLQNKGWVIVGLDTAYDEGRVGKAQVKFLRDVVSALGDRKLILLSHHHPFSLLAKRENGVRKDLGDDLMRKVFAWYWGHEHICALHQPSERWGLHGRCIGHSGYPYFRPDEVKPKSGKRDAPELVPLPANGDAPGALVLDGPNPYVDGHASEYGPHGYLTVHLQGEHLHETLYDCDGTALWHNDLA